MNEWMDGWHIGWQGKGWERAWVLDGITDLRNPLVLEVVQARSLMGALPFAVGGIVTPSPPFSSSNAPHSRSACQRLLRVWTFQLFLQ